MCESGESGVRKSFRNYTVNWINSAVEEKRIESARYVVICIEGIGKEKPLRFLALVFIICVCGCTDIVGE